MIHTAFEACDNRRSPLRGAAPALGALLLMMLIVGLSPCTCAREADFSDTVRSRLGNFSFSDWVQEQDLPFSLNGYLDLRFGRRLLNDPYEEPTSLLDARFQIEAEGDVGPATWKLTSDFLYDGVSDPKTIHLEDGIGWVDLREANLTLSPLEFMDVRAGRQILTWGTGDLIFINDLFPKDWNAFFIGRDEEYLKAPSDALKASVFSDLANLDLVFTPRFDSDRCVDNRRLSMWNPLLGRRFGDDLRMRVDKPDSWVDDSELAARLYRTVGSTEVAVYGYRGHWKNPVGFDPVRRVATFPRLNVIGASIRGNVGKGIGNLEVGWYDSRDDRAGDDPFVPNSQFRLLVGYEQELAKDFTGAVQYYLEYNMDHGNYLRSLPPGARRADEDRHVVTVRLTRLLLQQNLELSLFTYYSPSDNDAYIRPRVHYKVDDYWSVELGGNIFVGKDAWTFFDQFHGNTNVYAAVRYAF